MHAVEKKVTIGVFCYFDTILVSVTILILFC